MKVNYSHLMNEYIEVKFIHDQFKNNNLDLQETIIRESLNYKYLDEKIILYE